jgi:hypothetical protein
MVTAFMQKAQEVYQYIKQWFFDIMQYPYAKWIIIGIIALIIILIIVASARKRVKSNPKGSFFIDINTESTGSDKVSLPSVSGIGAGMPPDAQTVEDKSTEMDNDLPFLIQPRPFIEPELPLSPKAALPIAAATEDLPKTEKITFASLCKKLQSYHDNLSEELEAQCKAAGSDFLPDLVVIYERLDAQLAQNIKQLLLDEGWLGQYAAGLKDKDKSKEVLLKAWRLFPDVKLLPELVELLADKDENVRMTAVWLLTSIKDERSLPYLVAALLRPQTYLPARVSEVFAAFGLEAANLLAGLLPKVKDEHKLIILQVLGQFESGYQLAPLLDCLDNSSAEIRAAAIKALGDSNYHEVKDVILPLSHDSAWQVRAAVAKALGQLKVHTANDRLRQMLIDESFLVRANAKEALDILEPDN